MQEACQMSGLVFHDVAAVNGRNGRGDIAPGTGLGDQNVKTPLSKTRSLSDGGGETPRLSPSPFIFETSRRESKDDSSIRDSSTVAPSTPLRAASFSHRGLSLQVSQRDSAVTPVQQQPQQSHAKPGPLSPKLDHSHIYASPTNILPRRSRGLDFSRAATSLHHSTLADQASPDSSPTIGSRAMNIPGGRAGDAGSMEHSHSLWPLAGNQERSQLSGSLGSSMHLCSDSSSSSDDDDYMDEDMDEAFITTPQATKPSMPLPSHTPSNTSRWIPGGTPPVNHLMSFQQRQRPRKPRRKRIRGPLGLGFSSAVPQPALSKSPPNNTIPKEMVNPHSRRESISWAADQLHISGNESDDNNLRSHLECADSPSRPSVIKRTVTRRGNLLPKTKGFARIRAVLAEENAPVEAEFRREAEVVRQVRESDMDFELRTGAQHSAPTTAVSSPNTTAQDQLDDVPDDAMMMDTALGAAGLGLSGTFRPRPAKNTRGTAPWEAFSDAGGAGKSVPRVTPPPPLFAPPRGSSSGLSLEDVSMDSPSASSNGTSANPFVLPAPIGTSGSSGNGTPQVAGAMQGGGGAGSVGVGAAPGPPSAAEITRRINSKRRRDDDLDLVSFKRRAVSPGMSVHNSPIMQSPLQRDMAAWGSRPGSVGGDTATTGGAAKPSGSSAPSESGSQTGTGAAGGSSGGSSGRLNSSSKGRIGYQGMVDTNDGITKLSID